MAPWYSRIAVFVVCLLIAVVAIRGTLRQGPPLRWGDVYTTESNFANQLGLNGTLSLIERARRSIRVITRVSPFRMKSRSVASSVRPLRGQMQSLRSQFIASQASEHAIQSSLNPASV